MVPFTHQLRGRVSAWGPEATPSFDCFQHPVQCSHLIVPRHCLQNVYMGPVASGKHLNMWVPITSTLKSLIWGVEHQNTRAASQQEVKQHFFLHKV